MSIVGLSKGNDVRHNPDTNHIIYSEPNSSKPINPTWTKNPTKLTDIQDKRDHPHEIIAYILPDLILHKTPWDKKQNVSRWAKKYKII